MSVHVATFYLFVQGLGYNDCDDTVFCDCGASWYMYDYNQRHMKVVANGLRLHREHCQEG